MKISPINNQQYKISHKAVNQKYYNQAKKMYMRAAPYHNLLPIIGNIINCEIYQLITTQDAIDTLEAIKPYAQNDSIVEDIDDRIKDLKSYLSNQ